MIVSQAVNSPARETYVFRPIFTFLLGASLSAALGCCEEKQSNVMSPSANILPEYQQSNSFIQLPTSRPPGKVKWVWYAPTFIGAGGMPDSSSEWLIQQLLDSGVAVVGIDIGESYGNIRGREIYEAFYQDLITRHGFEEQGCMILQSRGGLMGYGWMMNHPGRVKCVAGIFPLLTMTDYLGVDFMAPYWGVSSNWINDNLHAIDPLSRVASFSGVSILHIHGDADSAVHIEPNRQFIAEHLSRGESGALIEVPGQGHYVSPEFFRSQVMVDFLKGELL